MFLWYISNCPYRLSFVKKLFCICIFYPGVSGKHFIILLVQKLSFLPTRKSAD